jgi:aspartyl-tRNA(Asn)/glutamyl-tRNA(Gln) amidotransferase subunit A
MATTTFDPCFAGAAELLELYRRKEVSPVDVTRAVLDRIAALDERLRAYLYVDAEGALKAARVAEAAYLAGNAGPLAGVPVSIKDLTDVRGMPTTYGSLVFREYIAHDDSWSVAKLRASGAVFLGKTNTPELGSLPTTENRLGEPARNPWNMRYTPGGSSGGAAAAVAAGLGPLALGTDFGGSIRIPAAFCGVFGFKPTLGRIARDTSFNLTGDFFSHEGPLSRTVTDAALYLDVTAGPDPRDRFSQIGPPPAFARGLAAPLPRLRLAWSGDLGYATVDRRYLEICETAARRFAAALGATATIEEVAPEGAEAGLRAWQTAGAAGNYNAERAERMRPHWDMLTAAVRRGFEMPEQTTLAQFFAAVRELRSWRARAAAFFERCDLLLTPALVSNEVEAAGHEVLLNDGERTSTFALTHFTAPFNATGQPAAVVPCGFTPNGLPVGLQIVGRFGDDLLVLQAARAFEEVLPWADARPPLQP